MKQSLLNRALGWITILAVIPLTAVAETQGFPFSWRNPLLASREDIQNRSEKIFRYLRGDSLSRTASSEFDEVSVSLFSEVHELFEGIANTRGSLSSDPVDRSEFCQAHRQFDPSGLERVRSGRFSCWFVKSSMEKTWEGFRESCEETRYPEVFVKNHPAGKVSFLGLLSLEDMIATIGEPLLHFETPTVLRQKQFLDRIRPIIAKVRYHSLLPTLNRKISDYEEALKKLREKRDCFELSNEQIVEKIAGLENLKTELISARADLVRLHEDGLRQAARDRQRVLDSGRFRPELPFPSLTDQEREFGSTLLGAIFWRARGGGILQEPKGTQLTRIFFTYLPMGMLGRVAGGDVGDSAGQNIYFKLFLPWGRFMDMGRAPGEDKFHDLVEMTHRGQDQVSLASNVLEAHGYDSTDLRMGGTQMGPCYFYSYEKLQNYFVQPKNIGVYGTLVDDTINWGEFCAGATISLGLTRSLLKGTTRID